MDLSLGASADACRDCRRLRQLPRSVYPFALRHSNVEPNVDPQLLHVPHDIFAGSCSPSSSASSDVKHLPWPIVEHARAACLRRAHCRRREPKLLDPIHRLWIDPAGKKPPSWSLAPAQKMHSCCSAQLGYVDEVRSAFADPITALASKPKSHTWSWSTKV